MEYENSKEDPHIQTVRTNQHSTSTTMLQAAISLRRELHGRKREREDSIVEKT
jgi:hypothetical protein